MSESKNKPITDTTEFVDSLMKELEHLSTVTESFVLPTKGRLDNLGTEKVTLRMMTTHEEKIRTGSKGTSFWKLMADIINSCIVEPKGLDVYSLTVVDFIFLMYKLRIISYGKDYKVNVTSCPLCAKPLKDVTVDLDELKVVYIDQMNKKYQSEPLMIKLPVTGWDIGCRMLRMKEYDQIQNEVDKFLEQFPEADDPSLAIRLSRQIDTIKGQKLGRETVRALVEKLPAADENAITQTLEKINMGINLTAKYKCPRCGKTFSIPLSYSEEFFRPSSD